MRTFYTFIIICMVFVIFPSRYIFAADSVSTVIGLVEECAYIENIKKYYVAVTTEKNPYSIFVGDNNKNFCSNVKNGDAYKISYMNIRYHKEGNLVRCFGTISNIIKVNKENYKKELSKIKPLQRSSGYLYLSDLRNPGLIKMYLDVINRK